MAEDGKPKSNGQKTPLSNIDPATVAKVDKMMAPDLKKYNLSAARPAPDIPGSAPLLPGDKLPDFNKKPAGRKPQATEPKKESPIDTSETIESQISKSQETDSDPATDKAIDEIVEEESSRMLAIEDAKAELLAEGSAEIDRGFLNRVKSKIAAFWHNRRARNATLAVILLAASVAGFIPASRYFVLNSVGVRASVSLRVIDDKTDQPLKNVEVSIGDNLNKTDIEGNVKLEKIKLGQTQMSVKKPAFADLSQAITVGWGSNPRGDIGLTAVGSRYSFEVKDYVSGEPVKDAEATSGEASATSNDNGEIVLVVADQDESAINIQISGINYRAENIKLEVGDKDIHQINLVPSKKHAFVSKRSGKYDLYKIDVDGKNEQKVLAGTGAEREDNTVILPAPKSNIVAYVSTRGDRHNKDGFALSSLMIVNLDSNKAETIDYSERMQPVDFIGNRLVYVKIAEGESAASVGRYRLISYDTDTKEQKELAKTNYFNDVLAAKGAIYYAPAAYNVNGKVGVFKINADGGGRITVYDKEVWNLFRVSYDKIDAAVGQDWYEYDTSSGLFNALNGAPPQQESRVYADAPDGKKSAWVDTRDGKGVLITYDVSSGQEKVIQTQSGLANPISWLDNDHLVYRVATSSETADYVISLSGEPKPKKIKDVTDTAGLDRWYYY